MVVKDSKISGISRLEVNGNNSLDGSMIVSNAHNIDEKATFVAIIDGMYNINMCLNLAYFYENTS